MSAARVRWGIAGALTVLAFGPSLSHIHQACVDYGATGWVAWATAASVDLLAVYAGLELRDRHRAGLRRWDAALILLVTVAATIAAQLVTAQGTAGGRVTAVWPAACFLAVMALIEAAPARATKAGGARAGARVKPQVTPGPTPRPAPVPAPVPAGPTAPVTLRAVTPDPAPAGDPTADRVAVVAGWFAEGQAYMVMVRAAADRWGVSETTAKRYVRAARTRAADGEATG